MNKVMRSNLKNIVDVAIRSLKGFKTKEKANLFELASNGQITRSSLIQLDLEQRFESGQTALHAACAHGHLQSAIALIQAGANIDADDSQYLTPLHHACANGHLDVVRQLIKLGATLIKMDRLCGPSALDSAGKNGHADVVAELINSGFFINCRAYKNETALHTAASLGLNKVVQTLLELGAEVNMFDFQGESPLHMAAKMGHLETAAILIEAGASLAPISLHGRTAMEIRDGFQEDVSALISARHAKKIILMQHSLQGVKPLTSMM